MERLSRGQAISVLAGAVALCATAAFYVKNSLDRLTLSSRSTRCMVQSIMVVAYGPGRQIQPIAGTADVDSHGVAVFYANVSHSGGTSRIEGRIYNVTSIPLFIGATFYASDPSADSSKEPFEDCFNKYLGKDTVSLPLLPGESQPFRVSVPTGRDTNTMNWRVSVRAMPLDAIARMGRMK